MAGTNGTDSERIAALERTVRLQQGGLELLRQWHEQLVVTVESLGRIVVSMRASADSSHGRGAGAN